MLRSLLFPFLLLGIFSIHLSAEPKYPADISYLVSDFKYSEEHGLKICEVQHGALSAVNGDVYIWGQDGTIPPKMAGYLASFKMKKWAAGVLYSPLKRSLAGKDWDIRSSIKVVSKDPLFLQCGRLPPMNLSSICSYGGIVYAGLEIVQDFDYYHKAFPGILFIDAATFPYWKDKYKMNALFDQNDELKQFKAEWRLYPKKYDPLLSERIKRDLPSEFYVIKPRKECLAVGVIVVGSEDLDDLLQTILKPSATESKLPDMKFEYWRKSKEDTFLIEKYYRSDYLSFSQPLSGEITSLGEVHYDATMRLAFILEYNEGKMSYHCLGGFWKLPSKALEEEGTLNEKRISCCKAPFYRPIDPNLFEIVNEPMERAMLLLYEVMLNRDSNK